MRRRLILSLTLALFGATKPAVPLVPRRIVSLNLCADQYLLALADPGQIAALTQFARDPGMSASAASARRVPALRGAAEEVLALRPDLIVAGTARRGVTMAQLRAHHLTMLELPSAHRYADIVRQVREVAIAVGHPDRGEALIATMDRQLAAIPRDAGRGATAAYYQRGGYLTGTGTLIDDLMGRVGLRNLARRLRKPALARLSLEQLALARPDYLIVETASERVTDEGVAMLHHPLLASIPTLHVPQAWTVCGGPAYPRAARSLAAQLARRSGTPSRPRR